MTKLDKLIDRPPNENNYMGIATESLFPLLQFYILSTDFS